MDLRVLNALHIQLLVDGVPNAHALMITQGNYVIFLPQDK